MSAILEPTFEGDFAFARAVPFQLAAGGELRDVTLRYAIYGELNARRDNAILVCHALSGAARVGDWWPQMFGYQGAFDLTRYCIIGINVIGSCYGSTGPASINPLTGDLYRETFPLVSIRDIVRAQKELVDYLGIERLHAVVGGSIGGMQAFQWVVDFNDRVEKCIAIGATPLSAMGLALNHLQRQAIQNDPLWRGGHYDIDDPPVKGLALARSIAMCSYKSAKLFSERFDRRPDRSGEDPFGTLGGRFDVAGYLDYQGTSFTGRFDANTYLVISKAMDTFELACGYVSEREALRRISADVLLVGISSDWLFPADDVRGLYERMKLAGVEVEHAELNSSHGHDAFLADAEVLAPIIKTHLAKSLSVPTTAEPARALKVSHAS